MVVPIGLRCIVAPWMLVCGCLLSNDVSGTTMERVPVVEALPWPADTLVAADSLHPRENQRVVAAALALFLGPFCAHRLYFGTTAKVPIVYGITFGGFGILALIDLGHILFTRDLSRYRNSDRVFMWAKPRERATPP